ncbi:MAG: hypothetical protein M3N50_00615 [Pseudomonadota bacterium]|nr:hypothetical protein [Pseudomonadota bacterium]
MSEWMKVMLGEISRKKAESELARVEEQRRRDEASGDQTDRRDPDGDPGPGTDERRK